jgi:DNA-binding SARP family transcriptional activator
MEFRILGPLDAREEGEPLPLGGPKQRALLAVLLLHANEVVSADRLIDALWGERAPETAAHTLQVYVSQVRKALRSAGDDARDVLVTRPPGYLLRVQTNELDLEIFKEQVEEGRRALAEGDPAKAARLLAAGLDQWRGPPLDEFAYETFAQAPIAELEGLRLSAIEDKIDANLALGRHPDLAGNSRRSWPNTHCGSGCEPSTCWRSTVPIARRRRWRRIEKRDGCLQMSWASTPLPPAS